MTAILIVLKLPNHAQQISREEKVENSNLGMQLTPLPTTYSV